MNLYSQPLILIPSSPSGYVTPRVGYGKSTIPTVQLLPLRVRWTMATRSRLGSCTAWSSLDGDTLAAAAAATLLLHGSYCNPAQELSDVTINRGLLSCSVPSHRPGPSTHRMFDILNMLEK